MTNDVLDEPPQYPDMLLSSGDYSRWGRRRQGRVLGARSEQQSQIRQPRSSRKRSFAQCAWRDSASGGPSVTSYSRAYSIASLVDLGPGATRTSPTKHPRAQRAFQLAAHTHAKKTAP